MRDRDGAIAVAVAVAGLKIKAGLPLSEEEAHKLQISHVRTVPRFFWRECEIADSLLERGGLETSVSRENFRRKMMRVLEIFRAGILERMSSLSVRHDTRP
jgi:hypothetical protein